MDADTWLWGDTVPDYEGLLAEEVTRKSGGDIARRSALARIADRLLDRSRVRKATAEETASAAGLLEGWEGVEGRADAREQAMLQRVEGMADGDAQCLGRLRDLVSKVCRRVTQVGSWDGFLEDCVPPEIQPLHMPAVQEALGALIPRGLQASEDKSAKKGKDDFGAVRGGSALCMDNWRVSVRAEDALARGQLQEDALEFFLHVLEHACKVLHVPFAIGSKNVGREVGRQEASSRLSRAIKK